MIDENRPYRRIEIDREFLKAKRLMHTAALSRGEARGIDRAHYYDIYTGKELLGGDPYDYEHIRSSEEIHSKYKSILTDEQIALVVNCPENIGVTLSSINKSKGKRRMEDWLSNSANIANNEINLKLTLANLQKADREIEKMVTKLSRIQY
jgi:isocitrate dehydrogenase